MFQQAFQTVDRAILTWPLIALLLFMAVFVLQVVRILRAPRHAVNELARMPLAEDAPPRRDEEVADERR